MRKMMSPLAFVALLIGYSASVAQPPVRADRPSAPNQISKEWSAATPVFCWDESGNWAWYERKQGAAYVCAAFAKRPDTKPITGARVAEADPRAKTFKVSMPGTAARAASMTFSAARLKEVPKAGSLVGLMEDPRRFVFPSCEECNSVCPGVCFMGPDNCRCYLFHLRSK